MREETAIFIGYIVGFLTSWKLLPWIGKRLWNKKG